MLNMQSFYALLTQPSEGNDLYQDAMAALTRADRAQVRAFESDLVWQQWDQPTPEVVGA